jgi:predicted ATPase/DNA-binding CsgD family transcriptional regulator
MLDSGLLHIRVVQGHTLLAACLAGVYMIQQPLLAFPSSPGQGRLPQPLTPLLGRKQELAHLVALLRHPEGRLLTLTGPGGVGKTRLSLAVTAKLQPTFADGVCFVPLAAINDPAFVLPAIAQALGVRETSVHSVLEKLQVALATQSLLLLLDNFEYLLAAAPPLVDLLGACPNLRLLVTSRAALRLSGEQEYAVSPLPLPDLNQLPPGDTLAQFDALTLFVQRAQAITPQFQMTTANAHTIAEICIRLDGLPLAIELAAARTRLLSPQALLSRLSHRLEVLIGGARNVPDRQQTMRATIAWSYYLLTPQQQHLFRRLAIFAGGCTLQALAALAQGEEANAVQDGVHGLLENHLISQIEQADGEPRLLLLETIREYGLERLAEAGELEATQVAHACYYLALAEEAEPRLREVEQEDWIAQFERERENLRTALRFLLMRVPSSLQLHEGHLQAELALRLCVALSQFWHDRGSGREGISFLMQALEACAEGERALRARALHEIGNLADIYALHLPLEQFAEESLALSQELGDPVGIASSLLQLGSIARARSRFALAQERLKEAAARYQDLGDRWMQGQSFTEWARVATEQGQYEQAHALLKQSLHLYQDLGDQQRVGWVRYLQARLLFVWQRDQEFARHLTEQILTQFRELGNTLYSTAPLGLLGHMRLKDGDLEGARPMLEECLTIGKHAGVELDTIPAAFGLARLLALQGDVAAAYRLYQESLSLLSTFTVYQESIAWGLEGLAALEAEQSKPEHAVRLWGAAEALREAIGAPMYPVYRASYEQAVALARTKQRSQAFAAAWAQGREMTAEQALALATQVAVTQEDSLLPLSSVVQSSSPSSTGLTRREQEVLRWLATGLTNPQIAQRLGVSLPTVNTHVASIFNKLGVTSRSAATRSAIEHHLA